MDSILGVLEAHVVPLTFSFIVVAYLSGTKRLFKKELKPVEATLQDLTHFLRQRASVSVNDLYDRRRQLESCLGELAVRRSGIKRRQDQLEPIQSDLQAKEADLNERQALLDRARADLEERQARRLQSVDLETASANERAVPREQSNDEAEQRLTRSWDDIHQRQQVLRDYDTSLKGRERRLRKAEHSRVVHGAQNAGSQREAQDVEALVVQKRAAAAERKRLERQRLAGDPGVLPARPYKSARKSRLASSEETASGSLNGSEQVDVRAKTKRPERKEGEERPKTTKPVIKQALKNSAEGKTNAGNELYRVFLSKVTSQTALKIKAVDLSLKVRVGGLAAETTWQDLKAHFDNLGAPVQMCALMKKGTRTACVTFKTKDEVAAALSIVNGTNLAGRAIKLFRDVRFRP